MPRTYSAEYKRLQPYIVEEIRKVVNAALTGASGSGGSLAQHPLNSWYHTGELAQPQAPWAATKVELSNHAADPDAHHARVTAGTGISVTGQQVGLAAGANYQFIGTGAGTAAAWQNISGLAGAGITYATGTLGLTTPGTLTVSTTNSSTGSHTHAITASSSPGQASALLKSGSNGELTLYNGFFTQGAQSAATFASGWAGSGWRADYGITTAGRASMETDDLTVRGRMRVYELLIQQIRATNGSVLVTSSSKVVTVSTSTNPLWTVNGSQLTLNGSNATLTFTLCDIATSTSAEDSAAKRTYHGFLPGDIIRAQQVEWNGSAFGGVIQSNLEVTSSANLYSYKAAFVSGDLPAVGYDYVRLGNTTDTTRQGIVYLTSDDSAAPFIDIVDGVRYHSDFNSASVARARFGKLTGISDVDFGGALAGYGIYANNAYLKGQIVVTGGSLGGLAAADVNANTTTIDGGHITANSVTAAQIAAGTITTSQLNFTPVQSTNVVASINATAEGIRIAGNRISIDGNVTFSSGYDPTGKIASGGAAADVNANVTTISGGKITAHSITGDEISLTSYLSINSNTFGNAGAQIQYNAGAPRFYVGDGSNNYLKYESGTTTVSGTLLARSGGISGNFYVGSDVGAAGNLYVGSNADIRMSGDGIRLVLPNLSAPTLATNIPTNSSALRWFSNIGSTWTNAANYAGQVSYRDTSGHYVDWVAMSYVGSTDYATYYARAMLYANRYNGSTNKESRIEAAVDPGTGASSVTAACDGFYATGTGYFTGGLSADYYADHTPYFEGDAVSELRQVRGKMRGAKREIDHSSLPQFARRKMERRDGTLEEGRDLGAMISMLVVAVQQLDARLDALEGRGNGRQ